MTNIENLQTVNSSISEWLEKYQRPAESVRLIAVSKTRNAEEVLGLHQAGQLRFGENYLQESLEKVEKLNAYPIEWHFIGSIQSRKAAQIAETFSWVHSVDRLKVARKLNQHATPEKPLNVLIQVNLEGEASKGGVAPDQLAELAHAINSLDNLHLRGLMFMPKLHAHFEDQRAVFQRAKALFDELQQSIPHLDQLSMGMSGDLEAAIAEGATIVRVGTALFGPRQYDNSDVSN